MSPLLHRAVVLAVVERLWRLLQLRALSPLFYVAVAAVERLWRPLRLRALSPLLNVAVAAAAVERLWHLWCL